MKEGEEMEFEVVIGLEIHVELNTLSKMFCGCSADFFGAEPNTLTCPVCLGLPGALPVANETALNGAATIGLALACSVSSVTKFDRKNYFYPDMPKDYQISQYDMPVCTGGYLDVEMDVAKPYTRRIGINRVHLEEDTGKLIHIGQTGRIAEAEYSLLDFNRAGVPLVEIVTEPDIRSADEAKAFAQALKNIIEHLGVSDCDMEKGSFRCDANISLRPKGSTELGTKSEVKNMNSFKSIQRALAYEIQRQTKTLLDGGRVIQETRHFDAANNTTSSLRSKEEAHDYRYFPEPDLVPKIFTDDEIRALKAALPELPMDKRKRFMAAYDLSLADADFLTSSKATGDYFEEAIRLGGEAKKIANWVMGELSMHLNAAGLKIDESAVTPKHLVSLLKLIDDGTVSGKMAKEIFADVFETGKLPGVIVEEKGFIQLSDAAEVEKIVMMVLGENPKAVQEYKQGKERAIGFLVGQAMRLCQGRANPTLLNEIIKKKLAELS